MKIQVSWQHSQNPTFQTPFFDQVQPISTIRFGRETQNQLNQTRPNAKSAEPPSVQPILRLQSVSQPILRVAPQVAA